MADHEKSLALCFGGRDVLINPFHVCGNAAKLEDKTKEIFASVKQSYCSVLQIGCIPTDVKGVYSRQFTAKSASWERPLKFADYVCVLF